MSIPNIQDYNDKVAKNLINIEKIDDENMAIATKQYSPEDGVKLPDNVVGVTITEVDQAIADKKAELADLEAFKKDLLAAV